MNYEIIDESMLNYCIPKDGTVTVDCPHCGKKRTLVCFNVKPVGGQPQMISHDYSVCVSTECRMANKDGMYPLNTELENLLRAADLRDNIPQKETEAKLDVLRKHYKKKRCSSVTDGSVQTVDWQVETQKYKLKYDNSCIFNEGMKKYLSPYKFSESTLGRYLCGLFNKDVIDYVAGDIYGQFLYDPSEGQTQYAYYDFNGNLRNIKSIQYQPDGHRVHTDNGVKQGYYYQNEIEKKLEVGCRFDYDNPRKNNADYKTQDYLKDNAPNFRFKTELFLFGEHLLKDRNYTDVYVLESEKSALIMQMYCYVNHINAVCVATGSLTYFSPSMFVPLKGHNVVFFADNDKYKTVWETKAKSFGQDYFKHNCEHWWELFDCREKDDLADVIISKLKHRILVSANFQ